MNYRILTLGIVALAVAPASMRLMRADIIQLTNGTKINGTLQRTGDVITIKSDDGKITTTKPSDIAKVTLTTTAAQFAADKRSSLTKGISGIAASGLPSVN